MTPDEVLNLFSSANWRDKNLPAAAEWLKAFLESNLRGHQTMRTVDLFAALDVPEEKVRTVTNALYKLRASGLVDGYYRRDSTKRWMGKGIILWCVPLQPAASPAPADTATMPEVSEEDF